jgi:DNA polymerase IV
LSEDKLAAGRPLSDGPPPRGAAAGLPPGSVLPETSPLGTSPLKTSPPDSGPLASGFSTTGRCVLHVDMDAFYVAVEVKEDPTLSGRPVVVGGTGNRGVVASASYEARAFGIRSAMPATRARRLCPRVVFLPPRFELYHRYSERLHEVLRSFTPIVEGLGLDEAFLDMSGGGALFGAPDEVAPKVRERVITGLGLDCSVGAGPNKLIAKLASKAAKPQASRHGTRPGAGTVVVSEEAALRFLWPMPVEALFGVGPAGSTRLHELGVMTVGQLAALPLEAVVAALGKTAGKTLHSLARGRDSRPVVPDRAVKSIGHEETYPTDIADREELERRLVLMADSVAARVRDNGFAARTVTLKLRYGDFTTLTRSHTFASPQTNGPSLWASARLLLSSLELKQGVRLLGLSASGLVPAESAPGEQLQLELTPEGAGAPGETSSTHRPDTRPGHGRPGAPDWARATEAVDAVRARFGTGAINPTSALGGQGGNDRQEAAGPAPMGLWDD